MEDRVIEMLHGKDCKFEVVRDGRTPDSEEHYLIRRNGEPYKGPFDTKRAAVASVARELE